MNKFTAATTDKLIASELFARIELRRKAMGITQAAMAERVDVTPKTYRNLKEGACSVMVLLTILRQLNLLENLEALVPPQELRPSQVWRQGQSKRAKRRAVKNVTATASKAAGAKADTLSTARVQTDPSATKVAEPTQGYSEPAPQKPSHLKAVLASRQRLKSGPHSKK